MSKQKKLRQRKLTEKDRKTLNTPIYKRIGLTKREYEDNNILKAHERDFIKRFIKRGEDIKWIKRDSLVDAKTGGYYQPTISSGTTKNGN